MRMSALSGVKTQDIHHPQGQAQGQRRRVRVFVIDRRRHRQGRRRILSIRQTQAPVRRPYRKACVVADAVNQTVAVIPQTAAAINVATKPL